MPSRRRTFLSVPVFIAVCSIRWPVFRERYVRAASNSHDDPLSQSLKSFTKVYDVVETELRRHR